MGWDGMEWNVIGTIPAGVALLCMVWVRGSKREVVNADGGNDASSTRLVRGKTWGPYEV